MTTRKSGHGAGRGRVRREPPLRLQPDRSWTRVLRKSDSWSPGSSVTAPSRQAAPIIADATADGAGDRAFDGVRAGYDLIETHIRRARAVAAQYGKERISKRPVQRSEEIKAAVARVFRTLSDLAPVVGGLINMIGAEGFAQALSGANPLTGVSGGANFSPAASRVVIEISSNRRAAVSCDLSAGAERRRLTTRGLEARSGQRLGRKALTFAPASGGKPAALRIRVPDNQPSGIYGGLLLDRMSGEPQGVVTVRVTR
jgi:hypothetical protein